MNDIETRARQAIGKYLGIDPSHLVDTAKLSDDLNLDSLDRVEMSMVLEEEFGIEIADEELERWNAEGTTLRDVFDTARKSSVQAER